MTVVGAKLVAVSRLRRFSERLIGRERELEALVRLARIQRLVTVAGPEGIGKTALALAGGERLAAAEAFPGGVWLLSARGVACTEALRRSVERIPPASLILLDCLDIALSHRREAALVWLHRLLESHSEHHLLATARSPIGLAGERVLELDTLLESDARRLLVGRADADIGSEEAGALTRLLENNPRALVLSAALLSRLPAAALRRTLEGTLLKAVGLEGYAPAPLTVMLGIADDQPPDVRRLLLHVGFAEEEDLQEEATAPGAWLRLARRLLAQGWYSDALEAACDALEGYQLVQNPAGRGAALLLLAQIAEVEGEIARAVLVLEEAATVFARLGDNDGLAAARERQARAFTLLEQPEAACAALWSARLCRPSPRLDSLFEELNGPLERGDLLEDLEADADSLRRKGLTAVRLTLEEAR